MSEVKPGARSTACVEELDKLAEEIGAFIRYWGFKRIHGKIWTHLYLSDVPLDAGTLMRRLNVSKALMSLSLHDLLEYDVIREAGKSEKGTQVFVPNMDLIGVILNVLRVREQVMFRQVSSAFQALNANFQKVEQPSQMCKDRVALLGAMIEQAQTYLVQVLDLGTIHLEDWRDSLKIDQDNSELA